MNLKSNMKRTKYNRGMTLIELMIVVVVVAILASIAYPAYQDSIRKSRRADAKSALMDAVARMERHYTQFGRYSGTLASSGIQATSPEGYYVVSATITGVNSQTFTLTATPQGDQVNDMCANLGIDETQSKTNSAGVAGNICGWQ